MKVLCNGVFDVLHVGHFNLLMYARQIADQEGKGQVVVAMDEDELVMANKGLRRPIFDVHDRAKAIMDLRLPDGTHVVDQIELFMTNMMLHNIIKRQKPDVIIKGSDWKGKKVIGDDVARVVFYERENDYSTSIIIDKIVKRNEVLK